ncbi:hypothetical protein SAMN06298216_1923 [Spirosomataceae bacterium TFI 002]|nr:hypothetical protein SAMN06298216_1923 [Spirosomataceae bacterium TFI 002]
MIENIPFWVSIAFFLAIPFPVFMIAGLVKKYSSTENSQRNYAIVLGIYAVYFAYVAFACFQGWFAVISLPPRILILSTIPLLVLMFSIFFFSKTYKEILQRTQVADIVRIHIFRLIGSFFLILLFYKALPPTFSLIAGLGDLITAISSIFVAKALVNKKAYAKKLALAWNTFGLLDILATMATAFILTKLSIETGTLGVDALAIFPFCFIPAFAPPTIIFLHLSIYKKLLSK